MKRCALAGVVALAGCGVAASPVPRFGMWDLADQHVIGPTSTVVFGNGLDRNVEVLVTVGLDGKVIEAKALDDNG